MNRSLIWKGVGILFAVVGLYFMMQSIQFYVECCRQVDWPMETATVVAVEQRWERSGSICHFCGSFPPPFPVRIPSCGPASAWICFASGGC